MATTGKLDIGRTLYDAYEYLISEFPTDPEPVIVLAAYLHSLVDGHGLTESQHLDPMSLERAELPEGAREFVDHFIAGSADDDSLRAGLYEAFTALSGDLDTRRALDGNQPLTPEEFLLVAQVGWNLEANNVRVRLPLVSGTVSAMGRTVVADMKVPDVNLDFATMSWTKRRNQRVDSPRKSAGASFGRQVARLAVLTAKWLVGAHPLQAPGLGAARLLVPTDRGPYVITWVSDAASPPRAEDSLGRDRAGNDDSSGNRVLVGNFIAVGMHYQPRGFDDELELLWADGGDRRVWLHGGPGLGKSFAARRIMQESLESLNDDREALLIWVDSANAETVIREFARAADQIGLQSEVEADAPDREVRLSRRLLEHLTTSEARWLVVLDNADAEDLIGGRLVPPGTNPRGRVLMTSVSSSQRSEGSGRQLEAEVYSSEEAEAYLAARLPIASSEERTALSKALGHHPLGLSIAASTIVAEGMAISDWLTEFVSADRMDVAADHSDAGGYPHLIGSAWRLALSRAAQGLPDGVVERAAIVASLQDPDGHPTWLWRSGAVNGWVAAGLPMLMREGRLHPAIKRLVDFGILRLDGSWREGTVAIHQLAARAIRELADPEALVQIAAILADEWLLQISGNSACTQSRDISAGIRTIAELPGIESATIDTALVLLRFSEPSSTAQVYDWKREDLGRLEPILLAGGATGSAELARRRADLGYDERDQDRLGDAQVSWSTAALLYEQCLADPTLEDEFRAKLLAALAAIEDELGRVEQARRHREQSIRSWERVRATASTGGGSLSMLVALTDLHRQQMDDEESTAALDRALAVLVQERFSDEFAEARWLTELAGRLRSRGRLEEALALFRRAAELYSRTSTGRGVYLERVGNDLASTYAELGRWSDAEEWFLRSRGAPAMIASVQLRQGCADRARQTIRQASAAIRNNASHEVRIATASTADSDFRQQRELDYIGQINFMVAKAMGQGRDEDATGMALRLLDVERAAAIANPDVVSDRLSTAYAMAAITSGNLDLYAGTVSLLQLRAELEPQNVNAQKEYGGAVVLMADAEKKEGALESAIDSASRAVDIFELNGIDPTDLLMQVALHVLADSNKQLGNLNEAIGWAGRRVTIWQGAMAKSHTDRDVQSSLADAYEGLVKLQFAERLWEEVAKTSGDLLNLRRSLAQIESGTPESQSKLADALLFLGNSHENLGRFDEALAFTEEAVSVRNRLVDRDPTDPLLQSELAHSLMMLFTTLNRLDRDEAAVEALSRAVDYLQLPTELDPNAHKSLQVGLLGELASGFRQLGRNAEADAAIARSDELNRRFPDSEPNG